jgi:hypothetical protein
MNVAFIHSRFAAMTAACKGSMGVPMPLYVFWGKK